MESEIKSEREGEEERESNVSKPISLVSQFCRAYKLSIVIYVLLTSPNRTHNRTRIERVIIERTHIQ